MIGIELVTPGSAVRLASVARQFTDIHAYDFDFVQVGLYFKHKITSI